MPCCMNCWTEMGVSERLTLAHRYAELFVEQNQRVATVEVLQTFEALVREALEDFRKRVDREPWQE